VEKNREAKKEHLDLSFSCVTLNEKEKGRRKEGKKRKCVLWSVTSFLLFFTERKRYEMK